MFSALTKPLNEGCHALITNGLVRHRYVTYMTSFKVCAVYTVHHILLFKYDGIQIINTNKLKF